MKIPVAVLLVALVYIYSTMFVSVAGADTTLRIHSSTDEHNSEKQPLDLSDIVATWISVRDIQTDSTIDDDRNTTEVAMCEL